MRISKIRLLTIVVASVFIVGGGLFFSQMLSAPVIQLSDKESEYLYIPTDADFDDVRQLLQLNDWLVNDMSFTYMAQFMNYIGSVKSGRYIIDNGMTSRELIRRLRAGEQSPVNVTFNNIRKLTQLAAAASRNLEVDSVDLIAIMSDSTVISQKGFNKETFPAMFIPNTYQFMWNTTPAQWVDRMHREYETFWNESRLHKADSIGLSPIEVSIVASIIEEETNKTSELPIVAGLYINRLRKGMPLQACPTIKYALDDFTLRRILRKDQEVESPYNTYKYKGLPPGPIRIPSIRAIDAVLNAASHKYLFMCARPDNSGGHYFARTNAEHQRNAAKYHRELNKKKIYR